MNKKEIISESLLGLYKNGSVTPKMLVNVARNPESPLHPFFEWNDEKAGENYRQIQASFYLRTYTVIFDKSTETVLNIAHVPNDKGTGEGKYMPVTALVLRPNEYESAMRELKSYMQNALKSALEKIKALEAAAKTDAQKRAAQIYRKYAEQFVR